MFIFMALSIQHQTMKYLEKVEYPDEHGSIDGVLLGEEECVVLVQDPRGYVHQLPGTKHHSQQRL